MTLWAGPDEIRTVTDDGPLETYNNMDWFDLSLVERGRLSALGDFTVKRVFSDGTPRAVDGDAFTLVTRRNPVLTETKTDAERNSQTVNDDFGEAQAPSGRSCDGFTVNEGTVGGFDYESNTLLNEPRALTSNFRCFDSGFSATTSDRWNYNPDNYVRTPNERRSIFATIDVDVWEDHNLRTDVTYQSRQSSQLLAPTPFVWGGG